MSRVLILAALATVFSLAGPVSAQDISGVWEISWETPRGAQTVAFTFAQDGTALTGSAEMTMGRRGGGGETRTVDVTEGKVEGDDVSFTMIMGGGQRSFTLSFTGSVDSDTMEGMVTNPRGGENPFTGRRKQD